MEELLRTNDAVLLSYLEALLGEADIGYVVLDTHMSILEGSLGMIPRRVLVDSEEIAQARRILRDAGLEHELGPA